MKKINQDTQIKQSATYDDTVTAGATMESAAASIEDDLNAIRSQIKAIGGGTNWYDSISGATDSVAIHDNVSGEIAAVVAKATPVSGDFLLIEDSAATNAKKSITIANIPHDSLSGYVANEHIDWTAASAGTIDITNFNAKVPVGGTAGQVLSKIDATNYNTEWTSPSAGGSGVTYVSGSMDATTRAVLSATPTAVQSLDFISPDTGFYKVEWSVIYNTDSFSVSTPIDIYVDAALVETLVCESKDNSSTQRISYSGFSLFNWTGASVSRNVTIKVAGDGASVTCTVYRSNILVTRLADVA